MDSRTHLDSLVFQLTPTRTRCDLVIFAGNSSEKLASGLLEPFLSHLKSAKDQISKGGYSITLRSDASWFTKATLERFVKFVSTPEVLERCVTIEKELQQIEKSIQSNEAQSDDIARESEGTAWITEINLKNPSGYSKPKGGSYGVDDAINTDGENSRYRLQKVLETRKTVLRKEQAMAYARALVAGFDLYYIDDLISFADTFGASRLREACINFMQLCKEKNEDRLWMDEIAAMQALSQPDLSFLPSSGIILNSGESDPSQMNNIQESGFSQVKHHGSMDMSIAESTTSGGSLDASHENRLHTPSPMVSSDPKSQVPMSWHNHLPRYMHNFQAPIFPQMPPYPGYMFPGMQIPPSYYHGNPNWPSNMEDSGLVTRESEERSHKPSSRIKKKNSGEKGSKALELDESTEASDSSSDSDSEDYARNGKRHSSSEKSHKKRHGGKSSRKVVIRNINYITPQKDGERSDVSEGSSANEDGFINGNSLRQQVEVAVGSFHGRKTNKQKKRETRYNEVMDEKNGSPDWENKTIAVSGGEKGNNNWDAFQNLLLKDESDHTDKEAHPAKLQEPAEGRSFSYEFESAKVKQRDVSVDSFVLTEMDRNDRGVTQVGRFGFDENVQTVTKKTSSTFEDSLFNEKARESGNNGALASSDLAALSSRNRIQSEEDWFMPDQTKHTVNQGESIDLKMVDAEHASSLAGVGKYEMKREVLIDDSFMIETRTMGNDQSDARLVDSDISMVPNITQSKSNPTDIPQDNTFEPDDLYMMLNRDSVEERVVASWTPEMDYRNVSSLPDVNKNQTETETVNSVDDNQPSEDKKSRKTKTPEGKLSSKATRSNGSVGKNKPDSLIRSKKPASGTHAAPKSKAEMEEERRRRMEKLLIQRHKRITERSTINVPTRAVPKKSSMENKMPLSSAQPNKNASQSKASEAKKLNKPVLRSSTIDRLSAARVTKSPPSTDSKQHHPAKATSKTKEKSQNSLHQKNEPAKLKKPIEKKTEPSKRKSNLKGPDEASVLSSSSPEKKEGLKVAGGITEQLAAEPTEPARHSDDFKDIKELEIVSTEDNVRPVASQRDYSDVDKDKVNVNSNNPSIPMESKLPQVVEVISNLDIPIMPSPAPSEDKTVQGDRNGFVREVALDSTPPLAVTSVSHNEGAPTVSKRVLFSPILNVEISTPPPSDEPNLEQVHSRKKWHTEDGSSKTAKGIRKLLFFGRKKSSKN